MVTKEQAIKAGEAFGRTEFHHGYCTNKIGPRGGSHIRVETWRANGKCQTWKTRPNEFSLPIKYGLRGFSYLTHTNANEFHLANECPWNAKESEKEIAGAQVKIVAHPDDHYNGIAGKVIWAPLYSSNVLMESEDGTVYEVRESFLKRKGT